MKRALIVQGGWDGHEPVPVSQRFARLLKSKGFDVEVSDTLDAFLDVAKLKALDLIVPVWTMGTITREQLNPVIEAVASGVGMAGCHGGMCDSFRNETDWQFMTGGQWIAHPGNDGTPYRVNIKKNSSSPLIDGLDDFPVNSEQYYVHVDPAVDVLATTRFPTAKGYHTTNGEVDVPVTWTKMWGYGRVFYTSLGHHDDVFDIPEAQEMMLRGMLWAADGKDVAVARGLDYTRLV
jgi:uncharacterized protein